MRSVSIRQARGIERRAKAWKTLVATKQADGYTLVDRGSLLTVSDEGKITAHVNHGIDDPPPPLRNEYAIIPTNPAQHDMTYPLAMAYVGYLTGPGQLHISDF